MSRNTFLGEISTINRMNNAQINVVLAENLLHLMVERGFASQRDLAKKAKIDQKTVSNCIHPNQRAPSKSGRPPSVTLLNLEKLAQALQVPPWVLLRPGASNQTGAIEISTQPYKLQSR